MLACYLRVSTVGQNEAGQRREIERWLAGNGHTDVLWFIDKESGDTLNRPAFKEMQTAIFAGEVDGVVVWKLDRLSRSIRDGINVLSDWLDRGVRFISVTQQLDFAGPTGKMIAAMLFGLAEMEQQTRKERQRVGIEAAQARGNVYKGRKVGTTKAKPRRAQQLRDKGLTHKEIGIALGVSRHTVMRYLAA